MNLQDIMAALPEIGEAQAAALLEAHAREMEALSGELAQLQEEKEALAGELERANAQEAERLEEERRQREKQSLLERLDAALGGRSFLHPRLRELIADDFARALTDPENEGLSDAEVFERVTQGQDLFASQNPPLPPMAAPGRVLSPESAHLEAVRRAMGLA